MNTIKGPSPTVHKSKFVQPAQEIKEAKNFVKNNPDIVFTKADKGNTTVALTRTDYNDKVNNLLQDVNTYLVRPKDYQWVLPSPLFLLI